MKILGYHPTRRGFLRALTLAAVGVPLVKLGRVIGRRRRRLEAADMSEIPWVGHC